MDKGCLSRGRIAIENSIIAKSSTWYWLSGGCAGTWKAVIGSDTPGVEIAETGSRSPGPRCLRKKAEPVCWEIANY